jgi:hypothetical protein
MGPDSRTRLRRLLSRNAFAARSAIASSSSWRTAPADTSPARQPLPETSLGPRAADSCRALSTAAWACARAVSISGTELAPASMSMPNPVHPKMTACAPRRTRSAIAALNFTRVARSQTWPWQALRTGRRARSPGVRVRDQDLHPVALPQTAEEPTRLVTPESKRAGPPVLPVRRARDRARRRPRGSPR